MKLSAEKTSLKKARTDVACTFLFEDRKLFDERMNALRKVLKGRIESLLETKDFKGKEGETVVLYTEGKLAARRLMLVGLGEQKKLTLEKIRRAAATAAKTTHSLKLRSLAVEFPEASTITATVKESVQDIAQALAEGAALALYRFDKYFTEKKEKETKVTRFALISDDTKESKEIRQGIQLAQVIVEATCFARDLENAPSNEIYPESLAEAARQSGKEHGFKVTAFEKRQIEKLGMGGLLAVNQGSSKQPRFIILEYGESHSESAGTVVLVGKGVTFDTGGISIKPASGMSEMKMDMSGAAAVIGTFEAVARLKMPVHLVGLIPATENMPGGSAVKPGDIVRHYGGKTSEVDNTDAEGRLILADALGYAEKYKPDAVIDLATLTGACVVALAHLATGMMGNDEKLMDALKKAGDKTYERVWPLPLFEEYEKLIKSDVADVKNVGGRWGGAITAALFLKKFVRDYRWVHLDIAGTAILEEPLEYAPKGGSGVGVRLLVEFLKNWKKNQS
ncbi:MAG: leucyl aminopeptidase [Bacteroidota bacterium]